ncbi:Transcriptional coactivator [Polyrhizophydium stewartii]|uniref:Transcriptional coactivator n=1 Tax=Polyrhizophydium stewartii TaxID=2732419 RepID=A0ABR4NGZ1_9FUNG|nr:Transcriptional coactivator [Polyrhizophydium stewartii]
MPQLKRSLSAEHVEEPEGEQQADAAATADVAGAAKKFKTSRKTEKAAAAPAGGAVGSTSGGGGGSTAEKGKGTTAADGGYSLSIGPMKRLTVNKFKGKILIDIREYYSAGGEEKPGKKGISITPEAWAVICQNTNDINAAISGLM